MNTEDKSPHLGTRLKLTRNLERIYNSFLQLGENVIQGLDLALSGLNFPNEYLEKRFEDLLAETDALAIETEKFAFTTLTLQQPLIRDLRMVIGTLKIAMQFSYLTHYVGEIIALAQNVSGENTVKESLIQYGGKLQNILKDALEAYKHQSNELSDSVIERLRTLGSQHDLLMKEIIESTDNQEEQVFYLSILRLFERVYEKNRMIAREIYFINTGDRIPISQV